MSFCSRKICFIINFVFSTDKIVKLRKKIRNKAYFTTRVKFLFPILRMQLRKFNLTRVVARKQFGQSSIPWLESICCGALEMLPLRERRSFSRDMWQEEQNANPSLARGLGEHITSHTLRHFRLAHCSAQEAIARMHSTRKTRCR